MGFWGKIFCEEGVVIEREFKTREEADAYSMGALDMIEAADPENDFLEACVGTESARDPDEPLIGS